MRGDISGLVLVRIILLTALCGLLFSCAEAACSECSFSGTDCSELWLNVNAVEVTAGENAYGTFLLHNYASERFFIDRVYAFDSDSSVLTQELTYDSYVKPGGSAEIRVEVRAEEGAEEKIATGYVEFRGHFLSGKECSYADSKKSFPIKIYEKKKYSRCESFDLIVPSTVAADGEERVEFFVSNLSAETAIIRLDGDYLQLSTNYFYVPSGVEAKKEFLVKPLGDKAWIEYKVELAECVVPSKFTKVVSSGLAGEITAEHEVEWTQDAFELTVKVKNGSGFDETGMISLDLPGDWNVEGAGKISVPAHSEKEFTINVFPPAGFEKETGKLTIGLGGEVIGDDVEFSPREAQVGAQGTAFAVLSGSALFIGLIAIALVLVALFVLPRKFIPKIDPWERGRKGEKAEQ